MMNLTFTKGNLISIFFYFDSNLQKWVPNPSPEHLLFRWISAQRSNLAPTFGALSQSETLSEIKPHLVMKLKDFVKFCGLLRKPEL